uniref:Uncharacterized protein n=1 Tax=Arundo donax TaxID=35708 RepID=A0A0A9DXD9_ARUDO
MVAVNAMNHEQEAAKKASACRIHNQNGTAQDSTTHDALLFLFPSPRTATITELVSKEHSPQRRHQQEAPTNSAWPSRITPSEAQHRAARTESGGH